MRRAERAAQRGRGEQARARVRETARGRDLDARDGALRERHREPPEPLGDRQERLEHAALVLGHERQVERVRDGQAAERGHDLLGDDDAGAILRLVRRARQMRREQQVGRVAQRRVGGQRLLREDVERRAGELARAQRLDERGLVDQRAARRVDEQRARRAAAPGASSRSARAWRPSPAGAG